MRNFWLEADIDGRATTLAGGPRAKDGGGGMEVDIRQMTSGRWMKEEVCWRSKSTATL